MRKKYDVIIVGCGVAGCFAALHLPKKKQVLMITKSDLEESDSFLAQGGICVLKSEEDYDSFFEDTLRAGHYENRKESVDIMIRSSREVIDELIGYGVDFARDGEELLYTREGAHSTNRILYHEDITGEEITRTLLSQVKKRENITLLTHTAMLDILAADNCCEGILLETDQGEKKAVFADYVLWACGGIGGIYEHSTNFPHLTGDALAISLRRGIRLEHVNYVQIHPTTLYSKEPGRRFLISESVRGEGAVLYNKAGERFVNELLPRDVVTREIRRQMEKDKEPCVWLSFLTIQDLDVKTRFPHIYQRCLEEGYDITKEPIPVVPAQHYFMGGVYVDKNSKTSMKRLYAAGETSCNGVHGANRLASNSLLESLVFAKRAVSHMLQTENSMKNMPETGNLNWEQIQERYQIRLQDYEDKQKYAEEGKELIWKAIRKEEKHESDHNQIKCG
ncbi:MAG: L-aspartate oxidase [Lachnospiraceae bacterium]|jgi:L-aspartate oxidase